MHGSRAMLRLDDRLLPAVIGAGGIRADKSEGDGATPAGLLPLRRVLYRADRVSIPTTTLPREAIAPEDGWCDDPSHPRYNRPVTLPFEGRHERLWRPERIYDVVAVLGWNDDPVRPGRGSAIFLHATSPDDRPTEGCIALAPADLLAVLAAGLDAIDVPG
nr:L,D-transpeptidase family protein [Jatrophihabitans endophyticus]